MKKYIILCSAIFAMATTNAQVEISDVKVPSSYELEGENLILNGAGLREKFFIDLYVAAFYTTKKSNNAKALQNANAPMVITLDIVSGMVTQEKMVSTVSDGFEDSMSKQAHKNLLPKIKKFISMFSEEIVEGDQFVLAYSPSQGTSVSKNNKDLGVIEGKDFKSALFGIWLGDQPADKGLKKDLLGR